MGWLMTQGQTRRELIAKRIAKQENEYGIWECIAHALRGNCLWKVMHCYNKSNGTLDKYIALDLLGCDNGYGWGYKDMEECMGPHYYTCPLKYLDMVPAPQGEYSEGWRNSVKAYHARMNRRFEVNQVIELRSCKIPFVQLYSLKPLKGVYNGVNYRIPKRLIK